MIPCILSADDEKDILDSHRKIMRMYGFEVRKTTKLKYMKKAIEADEIDCIHVDILFDSEAKVPDWDKPNGLSEVSEILQGRTDIPVMVISGYIDAEAKQKAEEYGISNSIYKWFSKPVDYDLVALDSIKAINERRYQFTKDEVIKHLENSPIQNIELLESALAKIPSIKYHIQLKPDYLLNKLENMCIKILSSNKSSDVLLFKDLIKSHLYDYFFTVSLKHLELADYFVAAISRVQDGSLMTDSSINLIMEILEKFKQDKLTDEEISKIREEMEVTFKIYLGHPGYGVSKYKEMLHNWLSGSQF